LPSGRERTLARLDAEWRAFLDAVDSVPTADLTEPGVVGDWTVRDLLVHVSSWEGEFLKALPLVLDGRRPPAYSTVYGGIDAFNKLTQEQNRGRTLDEVRADLEATHNRLLESLAPLPDDALLSKTRLARRLRLDTYVHYREHAAHLRAWAESRH
jgi:uncharacterized protein (TIGR03083 family)